MEKETLREQTSKRLREQNLRVPAEEEFVEGFEYMVRGFNSNWKSYIYPDKPEGMKHHPSKTLWVVTKL